MVTEKVEIYFHYPNNKKLPRIINLENVNSVSYHGNFLVIKTIVKEPFNDVIIHQNILSEEDYIYSLEDIDRIKFLKK